MMNTALPAAPAAPRAAGTVRLRLTFDVDYLPNGTPVEHLLSLMKDVAKTACAGDALIGNTSAVVDDFTVKVARVLPPL
jgi:hypothetical protein